MGKLKTSELRCINEVRAKSQRIVTCGHFLGTVIHSKRVILTCRECKQQYAIVGDNLEIKKLMDADIRLTNTVEVKDGC